MKKGIHPQYKETMIVCACGEVIQTKATKQNIKIDICSKCHPFFTGKQKLIDAAGRVDKFKKRYEKTQKIKEAKKAAQAEADKEKAGKAEQGKSPEAQPTQG